VIITSNLKVVVEPVLKVLCIFNISQKMDSSHYNVSIINEPFETHCLKMCWFIQSIVIFQVTTGTVQIGWIAVRTPSQTSLRCQAVRCQILQVSTAMRVMSLTHIRAIWPSHQVSAHKNLLHPFAFECFSWCDEASKKYSMMHFCPCLGWNKRFNRTLNFFNRNILSEWMKGHINVVSYFRNFSVIFHT
jgi:hypothetical protein